MGRRSGFLLAIEGIDGGGKSTLALALATHFRARSLAVVLTREPTDGPHGMRIRAAGAEGRLPADEERRLFVLDRRQHVREVIGPALRAGHMVISDRYYFSSMAYQGSRGFAVADLRAENEAFAPVPQALIVIDLEVELALSRILARRGQADAFERAETLAAVREVFLSSAQDHPAALVLDGAAPPERLVRESLRWLEGLPCLARYVRLP